MPRASAVRPPDGPSLFGLLLPSIPHARAAGAPTGRSPFRFPVFACRFPVKNQENHRAGIEKAQTELPSWLGRALQGGKKGRLSNNSSCSSDGEKPRSWRSDREWRDPALRNSAERLLKRKRGPVQAPFFIIDAPKPVTESRIGFRPPREANLCNWRRRSKSIASGGRFMKNLWTELKAK